MNAWSWLFLVFICAILTEQEYSDIRLVGGLDEHQGYVQVKVNNEFGFLCGTTDKTSSKRDLMCKSLGYP
mgnify:CR=1 FL=1